MKFPTIQNSFSLNQLVAVLNSIIGGFAGQLALAGVVAEFRI